MTQQLALTSQAGVKSTSLDFTISKKIFGLLLVDRGVHLHLAFGI